MEKCRRNWKVLIAVAVTGITFSAGSLTALCGPAVSDELTDREIRNAKLSMTAAEQGMVLLENRDNVLPMAPSGNIALFGAGAVKTVKGGTGSGDVNQRYTVSVWQGFKNAGYHVTSGNWLNAYSEAYRKAETEFTGGWFDHFSFPDMEVTDKDIQDAKKEDTDTAVYVIARNSGEGEDRKAEEGDYLLTETEKNNLKRVGATFDKVIVVLNVSGVIDTGFFQEIKGLDAMLLMSQAGMEGGTAVTRVLNGEVTPSGKLTDTWPKQYSDYPSADTFSLNDGDVQQEDYTEGLYVGYRYFDTFGVSPAYEFGYGMSYAEFAISVDSVTADPDEVCVTAVVKNISDTCSGREVVQVYFSAPDGELEKPYQELAAYAKTDELAPGESQELKLVWRTTELSSYSQERAAYIMESGDYVVRVGNSSRNTTAEAVITVDETVVTEQLSTQLPADKKLKELSNQQASSYTYEGEKEEIASAVRLHLTAGEFVTAQNASPYEDEKVTAYVSDTTETGYLAQNLEYELVNRYHGPYSEEVVEFQGDYSGYTLKDVYDGMITIEEFVSGLTVGEMADIVIGGNKLPNASGQSAGAASENTEYVSESALKSAQAYSVQGAAGETAGIYIESKKIPNIVLMDGPAGVRLTREYEGEDGREYYQFCTAWPIGMLLAQTWDTRLAEEVGKAFGGELKEYGGTIILAPGMNIHRNALCGRNFEYYSEDPFLTGTIGIAETLGVQSNEGIGVCIKHFAANNQEENRKAVNNTISERAFREIYLKAFEMVVKGARPMCIMSSYNLNNGIPAADDYDLLTDIPRGEWGFDGMIMTDWGGGQSSPSVSMHAGNDLIMPGSSVEDITVRGFRDQEPRFGEDGVYPVVTTEKSWSGISARTVWGEFVPDIQGDTRIIRKVPAGDFHTAVREVADENRMPVTVKVSDLLTELGPAAVVTEGEDGMTTVTYTGYYKKNNITLGDLQKSVINILKIVMQSNQFADMFSDVETVSYTEKFKDEFIHYMSNKKFEIK